MFLLEVILMGNPAGDNLCCLSHLFKLEKNPLVRWKNLSDMIQHDVIHPTKPPTTLILVTCLLKAIIFPHGTFVSFKMFSSSFFHAQRIFKSDKKKLFFDFAGFSFLPKKEKFFLC